MPPGPGRVLDGTFALNLPIVSQSGRLVLPSRLQVVILVVEVEGARTLLPACATPAAPGMVVQTESPGVVAAHRMVIELLLASGNHQCLVCELNGKCELQDLAYRYQVETPAFANPPNTPYYYEDDNTMIVRENDTNF